jgi:hypothetical protein
VPFSAIRPGTDLADHARQLVRLHDAVLGGGRSRTRPRPVVGRSWTRVVRAGLDPSVRAVRDPLPAIEVERRRRASPLAGVVADLVRVVAGVADASRFLLVVTDADGVVLWREGSSAVRRQADGLGFAEGAEWTEARVGTNAIGTALAEEAPVQLFSAEHFEQGQHPWYCTAHPVHDPRDGRLLGVVDISGPALTLHPAIEALVETAVRLAESRLWWHHESGLERIRTGAEHLLAALPGPALVVDDHGWVAHRRGTVRHDRIEAPRDGAALVVPGLGVCRPERLRDGWLVRPAGSDHHLIAVLDLTGAPALEIGAAGEPWRTALSRRHAGILDLLHTAGPAGLSAERLSRALYGDGEHVVTVRAEVSRLRRTLGAVVATRPYRIAEGVDLRVVRPADPGATPLQPLPQGTAAR